VEELARSLMEDFDIPRSHIAIATGEQRELDGVDLLSPACDIRYVITVEALKEGWDCPFAYVLFSVSHVHSRRAVEQILGRILRMPYAQRKSNDELNRAYAYVMSADFNHAAMSLTDALVDNGFTRQDASEAIIPPQTESLSLGDDLFSPPAPAVTVPRELFRVPVLALQTGDVFDEFEETHLLEYPWDVENWDAELTESDYSVSLISGRIGEVDIKESGDPDWRWISDLMMQMSLLNPAENWTAGALLHWLDRTIPHQDLTPDEFGVFMSRIIRYLMEVRSYTLPQLVKDKFPLRSAIAHKVNINRLNSRRKAVQELLFTDESRVVVSPELVFTFPIDEYPLNTPYRGRYQFKKHYYVGRVGDLKESGAEFNCATFLDQHRQVKTWVRNIPRHPTRSFWLQTATDKCYPDFVCELTDGRFLAVEYKGEDRIGGPDANEKLMLGELWERRSNGHCLFVMPSGVNFKQKTAYEIHR